jgi:transposase InsO family protein
MKLYHPSKGIKGIRTVLKQFNEEELSEYQRDLLHNRLRILEFWRINKRNVYLTAKQFKTSRSYIKKLINAQNKEGLGGLIPISPGPKRKRGDKLSHEKRCLIEQCAEKYPDWGHKKLQKRFLYEISESTIYRYLKKKEKLVRNRCPGYFKKPTPRSAWKIKRERLPQNHPMEKPGDLIVLDSIIEYVGPNFKKLYFVTCVDMATRIGMAMATASHSSLEASKLLEAMETILQVPIKSVLTDNGSEFLAHFHKACLDRNIYHFFIRPRTPKDNAVAERFNQTLQRNFYWRTDLTKDPWEINADLTKWLFEYNILRPHESLHMRPPAVYYYNTFYTPRYEPDVDLRLWYRPKTLLFHLICYIICVQDKTRQHTIQKQT